MRPAGEADIPAIHAFLSARIEGSMFPLANLARAGLGHAAPHAMRFWLAGDPLTGVIGLSGAGMVLPQIDPAQAAPAARALAGLTVTGLAGDSAQLRALIPALGLTATGEAEP
jgi:hypothetical protein